MMIYWAGNFIFLHLMTRLAVVINDLAKFPNLSLMQLLLGL